MALNSRDYESIDKEKFKEPWFTGIALFLLNLITKIPYFRKKVRESEGGLSGKIFRYQGKGMHLEATQTALFALEKFRHRKPTLIPQMHHHTWWTFMSHAVKSAKHIEQEDLKSRLIDFAESGIQPFDGYNVASAFLEFSRWEYRAGNHEKALEYAEIASNADDTWGEPDFLLGWFKLVLGKADAEESLSRAIEKDQRILFRVASNDVCKQYPGMIAKLKRMYSFENVEASSNNPRKADA